MIIVGAVGLLVQVKRFDLLIDAIKIIQDNGYNCGLVIIGGGPLQSQLFARANSKLRSGSFFFPELVGEADKYMYMFDVFCFNFGL